MRRSSWTQTREPLWWRQRAKSRPTSRRRSTSSSPGRAKVIAKRFLETGPDLPELPIPVGGQTIGAYTLERPLGAGGMGAVWLGRRSDGRFDGRVAIKLLNLALLDERGQARFRREGTVLARLSHPNIARLLDAGVSASGQPYLVLEYVDGQPIDVFADARCLGVHDRVRGDARRARCRRSRPRASDRPSRSQAIEHPGQRPTAR